ncbi:MAG: hypothetical protein OEZ68_01610 [Gammaproteobacteria bacterium]|nr:hypothetical protein [Gammaproteobacteria bacterium]MDH5799476.1 hypothetical protein [Gammaproteobacteria bacterium]
MKKVVTASLLSALAFLPQQLLASQATCSGPIACSAGASANLTLNVVIPAYIRFQLGDSGLVPAINFDYSAAPATVGDGTTTGPSGSTDTALAGGATATHSVEIAVESNTVGVNNAGSLTITVNLTDGGILTGVSTTNPTWAEFSVASVGGTISPPLVLDGDTSLITVPGTGFTNVTDNWAFSYANTKVLASGTYTGTLTYTVAAF